MREFNQFIGGGGLGGLLSAALLAKEGQKIFLAEKLPFFGGRFTSFKHHGFEVPTGAVHMIPHSHNGPLGLVIQQDCCPKLRKMMNYVFTHFLKTGL